MNASEVKELIQEARSMKSRRMLFGYSLTQNCQTVGGCTVSVTQE